MFLIRPRTSVPRTWTSDGPGIVRALFARRVPVPEEAFLGGIARTAGAQCRIVGGDDAGVVRLVRRSFSGWCDTDFFLLIRPLLVFFPCPYSCSCSSSPCRRCCSAAFLLLLRPVRA